MKSKLGKIIIVVVALLVVGAIALALSLNGLIKKGVETVGPKVTKVTIKLDSVSISPLTGGGAIKGLFVGNPEGYKTESAIKVGTASLAVSPASVLGDKLVIRSIFVEGPEITLEGGLKDNNLTQILANVQAFAGSAENTAAKEEGKGGKKLQVNEFVVKDAKVNVALSLLGGKPMSVTLPEIRLTDLGTGPEGITPGDLVERVFKEITGKTLASVTDAVGQVGKVAGDAVKGAGEAVSETTKKTTEGLKNLFKK